MKVSAKSNFNSVIIFDGVSNTYINQICTNKKFYSTCLGFLAATFIRVGPLRCQGYTIADTGKLGVERGYIDTLILLQVYPD